MTKPSHSLGRFASASAVATFIAATLVPAANATILEPGDYAVLPPGTNLLVQYLQITDFRGLNIPGSGDKPGTLSMDMNITRYVHYTEVFGMPLDMQAVLPYGSIHKVSANGQPLNSNNGIGDPVFAFTLFPISHPDTATYVGITPLSITLPWGKYDRYQPVNLGANEYVYNTQAAFQTAFGTSGVARDLIFQASIDWIKYGDNNRYVGSSKLHQSDTWQLQPWLTYRLTSASNLSLGYSKTYGGSQKVNWILNGTETRQDRLRLELQAPLTRTSQFAVELTHDTNVNGGYRLPVGFDFRVAFVF